MEIGQGRPETREMMMDDTKMAQPKDTMARADEWLDKAIRKEAEDPNSGMIERMFAQACKIELNAYDSGERRGA